MTEARAGPIIYRIPYEGGLRFPWLERIAGTPDRLSPLLAAR